MSYQVIARKWRPNTFEEVTGQEAITQTLRNAVEHDRLHHAYLFSGARGVGKTTTARLLAKALNCHKTSKPNPIPCSPSDADACASCREIAESRSIDVLEFDAASHTGVDDIREIILESININPARDRYKIFIIDEVHMLSNSSFNALLKTLEEPPPNVEFIMATTELHKVPATILSRCQEFEFRTIPLQKIFARLKLIAEAEKINISDEALKEISRSGEGSMRDAQSNFDQVISFSGEQIETKDVVLALGIANAEILTRTAKAIAENRPAEVLKVVDELISRGQDLRNFCRDLLAFFRDLLIFKMAGDVENLLDTAVLSLEELQENSAPFSESDLIRFFNSLGETETKLREATQPRYVVELGLVKLVEMRRVAPIEQILERLAKLESALANGNIAIEPEKKTLKAEIPKKEYNFSAEEVPFPIKEVPSSKFQVPSSSELQITDDKLQNESEISNLKSENDFENPNLNSEIKVEERFEVSDLKSEIEISSSNAIPKLESENEFESSNLNSQNNSEVIISENSYEYQKPKTQEQPQTSDIIANFQSEEFLNSIPIKLSPITEEELEHVDDKQLDEAFERKLARLGDNLYPIKNASKLVETALQNNTVKVEVSNGNSATAAAPARDYSAFMPKLDDETETEMPTLSENPTEEEMLAYAQAHPLVKKALRIFRGKITLRKEDK